MGYVEVITYIFIWLSELPELCEQFEINLDWVPQPLVIKATQIIKILFSTLYDIFFDKIMKIYSAHKYETLDTLFKGIDYLWSISKIWHFIYDNFTMYVITLAQLVLKFFFYIITWFYEKDFEIWKQYSADLLQHYIRSVRWGVSVSINFMFILLITVLDKLIILAARCINEIPLNNDLNTFKYNLIWPETYSTNSIDYSRNWFNQFLETNLIKESETFFSEISILNHEPPENIIYKIVTERIKNGYKPFKIYLILETNPFYEYIYILLYHLQYIIYKANQAFLIVCIKILDIVGAVLMTFSL